MIPLAWRNEGLGSKHRYCSERGHDLCLLIGNQNESLLVKVESTMP